MGDRSMIPPKEAIGYPEAMSIVLSAIAPLSNEIVPIGGCVDRAAAASLYAAVDSPSVDASLKDGYALKAAETDSASINSPARFRVIGTCAAGLPCADPVFSGTAARILTGAKIPAGADAVVAEEHVYLEEGHARLIGCEAPGRNIFRRGSDVARGECVCRRGERITPGVVGILAAAGFSDIPVVRSPRVGIIATGDEVVPVGKTLPEGKLYASNMATLNAWCRRLRMETELRIVSDDRDALSACLSAAAASCDAILTSGGAWTGDRDLVGKILDDLGWKKYFHRIRISPGKAVGFGMLLGKPVFILPGGPPSNLTAFLEIALPGLLKLAGYDTPELPRVPVVVDQDIPVPEKYWTQFIFGSFLRAEDHILFSPLLLKSRLQSIAKADGVICIPEGISDISKGSILPARMLH